MDGPKEGEGKKVQKKKKRETPLITTLLVHVACRSRKLHGAVGETAHVYTLETTGALASVQNSVVTTQICENIITEFQYVYS